ncbi:hypothetical protein AQ1_02510 [alpha proteobacterium Q-1]|nr:hypothetical protein AQ1_02510 [alpha proteobacterium Q-1]
MLVDITALVSNPAFWFGIGAAMAVLWPWFNR